MNEVPSGLPGCPPRGAGPEDTVTGRAKAQRSFFASSERSLAAFCFWLVFGFVAWNVVFDRRVAVAAVAFTREQTLNHQQGRPLLSIDDGFSPSVRSAAMGAAQWAGGLTALGLILSLAAARALRRPPLPVPPAR
jgi:hypothetical protein